ncbi:MAG: hypothetical protein ACT4OG_09505 [Alphaproteobacteria bacterium]
MQRIYPRSFAQSRYRYDALGIVLLALHLAVIAYVLTGWTVQSRDALFFYVLFLPGLCLQWILNRGSSLLTNVESYLRSGHWRDPENPDEGRFLQNLIRRSAGLAPSRAQAMTVACSLMLMFWQAAFFRMVTAPTP